MSEPITQAQDHDRLEGIAEQITEQVRQTNALLDTLTRWLVGMPLASLLCWVR